MSLNYIENLDQFETLDLHRETLKNEDIKALAEALKFNSSLTVLDF